MVSIGATKDADEVARLKLQVAEKTSELERLSRLLKLADPFGDFKPGTARARTVAKLAEVEKAKVGRCRLTLSNPY
jgi:hypothetical protein